MIPTDLGVCNDLWKKTLKTALATESEGHSLTHNTKSTKAFNGANQTPELACHERAVLSFSSQKTFSITKLCGQWNKHSWLSNLNIFCKTKLWNCALIHPVYLNQSQLLHTRLLIESNTTHYKINELHYRVFMTAWNTNKSQHQDNLQTIIVNMWISIIIRINKHWLWHKIGTWSIWKMSIRTIIRVEWSTNQGNLSSHCFLKKWHSINRLRNANCSEPEEILKTIWHIQSTYKQNTHCLLLLSFPAD